MDKGVKMAKIITLTTDFGVRDSYVGALKGALLSVNPGAIIVDISHAIEPGNIGKGAFVIAGAYSYFPAGTIHVGVVDPGVGGERNAIIVETEQYLFVGPDNGLFTIALGRENIVRSVELAEKRFFREPLSSTFHGRDIFAPVAAHLSLGVKPAAFGPKLSYCVQLACATPEFSDTSHSGKVIYGTVIYIDNFGNLVTSIREADIASYFTDIEFVELTVELKRSKIPGILATYSEVVEGEVVALIGSSGYLEVAVNNGSAASKFDITSNEEVTVSAVGLSAGGSK